MAKDPDVIEKYTLKVTYICPVTGEEITLINTHGNQEFELEDNGDYWPNNVSISVGKCKACGRYHDSFEL